MDDCTRRSARGPGRGGEWRAALRRRFGRLPVETPAPPFDFDALAKDLAQGLSRREALRRVGVGLGGAMLVALGIEPVAAATCPKGQTNCSGVCVNLNGDPKNCGACGKVCASGASCSSGKCNCPDSQVVCGAGNGVCVSTSTDPNNCGTCGTVCTTTVPNATAICNAGKCDFTCKKDFHRCGNRCVNTSTDPNNCGKCGKLCPMGQVCQNGACINLCAGVTCPTPDQCHNPGTCNSATGQCSNPAKLDGTACNDGNACTQNDTCQSGVCVGSNPVVCVAVDQCHVAGTCNPANGQCSNPAKQDGTACNDGNACTQTDTCQSGVCVGGNPVVCTASDQCHDAGTCDTVTGQCSNPAKPNDTACDDGNACTQNDTCQNGVCGGTPVVCTAPDDCHDAGACDTNNGFCSYPAKPDNTSCSSPSGGICTGGVCGCPSGQTNSGGRCCLSDGSTVACSNGSHDSQCCSGLCHNGACVACLPPGANPCVMTGPGSQTCGGCCFTLNCSGSDCTCGCPFGQANCSGETCTDLQNDNNNCGSCGFICPTGSTCSGGHCACASGGILGDNNNCGSCGNVCPGDNPNCVNGQCSACQAGLTHCGSVCVNTASDPANCGSCGNACVSGQGCCGGTCVDTQNDANHCGGCNPCPQGETCSGGTCGCGTGPGCSQFEFCSGEQCHCGCPTGPVCSQVNGGTCQPDNQGLVCTNGQSSQSICSFGGGITCPFCPQ